METSPNRSKLTILTAGKQGVTLRDLEVTGCAEVRLGQPGPQLDALLAHRPPHLVVLLDDSEVCQILARSSGALVVALANAGEAPPGVVPLTIPSGQAEELSAVLPALARAIEAAAKSGPPAPETQPDDRVVSPSTESPASSQACCLEEAGAGGKPPDIKAGASSRTPNGAAGPEPRDAASTVDAARLERVLSRQLKTKTDQPSAAETPTEAIP